jgi:hypothetical protein
MNRTKLAEVVTIFAGVATVTSYLWSFYSTNSQGAAHPEGTGVHAIISDELAGKIELTDRQIDELTELKIKSIQNLCPLVHQLCADLRQLKALKAEPNYNLPALRNLEQRVLKDKELILKRDLEDHETANRILGS